jgi:SAM-dependent methyltransferase
MNYQHESIKTYHSTHYKRFMPQTVEGWNWVVDRIKLNFGNIFSSISKDSLVLDVACGVGYLEHYLLKEGFTRIEAIDLSEEQIQVAKQKLKEYRLQYTDKVEFKTVDAFDYLRTSRGYDLIAMTDLLDHFQKDRVIEILQLSFSALNKGGFLIVRVTNADNPMFARFFYRDFTHETPFTPDSIRQCLEIAGFKVLTIDYEKIPPLKIGKRHIIKSWVKSAGLKILGKFFGISSAAFSEDLVVVVQKGGSDK